MRFGGQLNESPAALMASINHIGKQLYVEPYRWAEFLAYMRRYREVTGFESDWLNGVPSWSRAWGKWSPIGYWRLSPSRRRPPNGSDGTIGRQG